jgi:RNAse (barnase) inhibitor barstar
MQDAGFELLRLSSVTRFADPAALVEEVEALRACGYRCVDFDCSLWSGEADFHAAIAGTLRFPEYYGGNLAALKDCLFSLEIEGCAGVVLVFRCWDEWARVAPDLSWHILDIVARASRFRLVYGHRLLALLQVTDPELSFRPVGAVGVVLSQREWRARARVALARGRGEQP